MESNENKKREAAEKCTMHFENGYNCCETVILAFSELLDVSCCEVIPRIATPFGGGIHERMHMCGALSGAVMAVGLKHGRNNPGGDREASSEKAGRIVEKFTGKYGSANCIDIIGYDPKDPEKIIQDKKHIRTTICGPLIKQVAEWLWEELE